MIRKRTIIFSNNRKSKENPKNALKVTGEHNPTEDSRNLTKPKL
jgi:hypothetical protein